MENAQLGQVAHPSTNCIVAPHCGHSEKELVSLLACREILLSLLFVACDL